MIWKRIQQHDSLTYIYIYDIYICKYLYSMTWRRRHQHVLT